MHTSHPISPLRQELLRRQLLLDGAMASELMRRGFATNGNCNHVVMSAPEAIVGVHKSYIEAGSDIITTCTFNEQGITADGREADYDVNEVNRRATRLAVEAVEVAHSATGRRCFVAGSVGPTPYMLSTTPTDTSPNYDTLVNIYSQQITPMIEEGVDAILIETVTDPLNATAAAEAANRCMSLLSHEVDIMVSATVSGSTGHLPSGSSIEEFADTMARFTPLSIGINCSDGPDSITPWLRRLCSLTTSRVSAHPCAGLPDDDGSYPVTPREMAATIGEWLADGLTDIVGGCCGTTPAHISAIRRVLALRQGINIFLPSEPTRSR